MKLQVSLLKALWNIEQAQRHKRIASRFFCIVSAALLMAVGILSGAGLLLLILTMIITPIFALVFIVSLTQRETRTIISKSPKWIWNRPIPLFITTIAALTVMTGGPLWMHSKHIDKVTTSPEEGVPWREGLSVKVYWDERISEDARRGLADAAGALGFEDENVASQEEANLYVWHNSWAMKCKWPSTKAFASLDRSPDAQGSQWGRDIHLRVQKPDSERQTQRLLNVGPRNSPHIGRTASLWRRSNGRSRRERSRLVYRKGTQVNVPENSRLS